MLVVYYYLDIQKLQSLVFQRTYGTIIKLNVS